MQFNHRKWIGWGTLILAVAFLLDVGLASGARTALRSHWMSQQVSLLRERGPLVLAQQKTGMEMQLSVPAGKLNQDRLVRVLDRRADYAYCDGQSFSQPLGAQIIVNSGAPQSMVWVDAPAGEPDFFMGWIRAVDLMLWDNSGDVAVWDGDGHTVKFSLKGVF